MKILVISALVAAQLLQGSAAIAADLVAHPEASQSQMGAFAGARARIELGGRNDGRARIGLAAAPISRSQSIEGRTSLRYGEGFELGMVGDEPAGVSVAGQRLRPGGVIEDDDGHRLGVSTLGAAAIAAGVIVLGFVAVALVFRSDDD